jgi:signal recognition particle receptor subunit beta
MVFVGSDGQLTVPTAVKIVIAGGFGTGKTTMVSSVSEIPPLRTEELLTEAGVHVDDLAGIEGKDTTTVALDFGRITINTKVVLYLFGTPGQNRFWFMWDDLTLGAAGAIVLIDTRRIADGFAAIDFFEDRRVPFVVAVNVFDDAPRHELTSVREALALAPDVPLVDCDARQGRSVVPVLVTLVEHALARSLAGT